MNKTYKINLKSDAFNNYRCKRACDSLDIDIQKKLEHKFEIEFDIEKNFNIGLIYGNSGSGKTTLAKHIFGNNIFDTIIDENNCILNQLNEKYDYQECVNILNAIGLNSVPCWIRPIKTLSNGQKARAEIAYLLTNEKNKIIVIDEFTSVVDRIAAKAMAICIKKFANKYNKKIILLSCHNDIIEYLNPDWIIDCNKQSYTEHPIDTDFFLCQKKNLYSTLKKSTEKHGDILANIII